MFNCPGKNRTSEVDERRWCCVALRAKNRSIRSRTERGALFHEPSLHFAEAPTREVNHECNLNFSSILPRIAHIFSKSNASISLPHPSIALYPKPL